MLRLLTVGNVMSRSEEQDHWDAVYAARDEQALTWYEVVPGVSLELALPLLRGHDAVIDVGGGRSRFVERLVSMGFGPCTVLDISPAAIAAQRSALGPLAERVTWIAADITNWVPDRLYRLWHDRAVFHFLTEDAARAAYVHAMIEALEPGGHAIIATFDENGPEQCSGLPVMRYSPDTFFAEIDRLAPGCFERVQARRHMHITPKQNRQSFQFAHLRRSRAALCAFKQ